jgi:hypothetical protein
MAKKSKKTKGKVKIKDLPAKPAREDAVRGGAEPITGSRSRSSDKESGKYHFA